MPKIVLSNTDITAINSADWNYVAPRGMSLLTLVVRSAWKSASSVKQSSLTALPITHWVQYQ